MNAPDSSAQQLVCAREWEKNILVPQGNPSYVESPLNSNFHWTITRSEHSVWTDSNALDELVVFRSCLDQTLSST